MPNVRFRPAAPRALLVLSLAAALLAAPLAAQVVRGTVTGEGGAAVSGALVTALNAAGARRMSTLSAADGTFELKLSAPGRYTLRAERVGYASAASDPFELAEGATLDVRLSVRPAPLALEGVTATAEERRCRVDPVRGTRVAALWDEARKALAAAAWTQEAGVFRYEVADYERDLDPRTGVVRAQRVGERQVVAAHPYAAFSEDSLAERGYIRPSGDDLLYFAPDARVLLGDVFARGHCFALRDAPPDQPELIGLAFEPVRSRAVADVAGVLWMDRATAELRWLEYRYTRLAHDVPADRVGGRVEFRRLETGAWVVSRWNVRMPLVGVPPGARVLGSRRMEERPRLIGIRERGGQVTAVLGAGGDAGLALGTVEGTVFDSTRAAPLAGARVFLEGIADTATADSMGRFRLSGLPAGDYRLGFAHPRLDSLGARAEPRTVSLAPGAAARADLAIASPRTLYACAAGGAVAGRVRDRDSMRPMPGARVSARWSGTGAAPAGTVEALADSAGRFVLCGVPTGAAARLRATGPDGVRQSAWAELVPAVGRVALVELDVRGMVGGDEPILLEEVRAVARASQRMREVEARRRRGNGAYVTRDQIDQRRPVYLADLFQLLPNVRLVPTGTGNDMAVRFPGAAGRLARGEGCEPQYFVDGTPLHVTAGGVSGLNLAVELVQAIEAYRPGQAPVQFSQGHADCGVIVIWTAADYKMRLPAQADSTRR